MAKRVQRLGHGAAQAAAFIGLEREVTVDTSQNSLRVHDGVTEGGTLLAVASMANVADATANNPGRMSAQQAGDLAQALLDIATNTSNIAANTASIASNTSSISSNTTAIGTKIAKMSGATPGHAVVVKTGGEEVESAGYVPARLDTGTKAVFVQNSAPVGWTFDATQNDRVLRITSTVANGGNIGGSWTISGVTVDGTVLTIAQMPAHDHVLNQEDAGVANNAVVGKGNATGATSSNVPVQSTGGNQPHAHGLTSDGSWRPQYQDVIVCTRN